MTPHLRPLMGFFGHHKCATAWIGDILRAVCRESGRTLGEVTNTNEVNGNLQAYVDRARIDLLAFVNADYTFVSQLRDLRGFHIVRDPRDIAVSSYFSQLKSHPLDPRWPELIENRERLQSLSKEDGLMFILDERAPQFRRMLDWPYADPRILELRMEDLTQNAYEGFMEVFTFLGLVDPERRAVRRLVRYTLQRERRQIEQRVGRTRIHSSGRLPVERLLAIVWENRFAAKANHRQPGHESAASHYRRGVSGDWRNHFNADHIAYFKTHYNPLLLKLGYEQTDDWT